MTKRSNKTENEWPAIEAEGYRCSDGAYYTDMYMAREHEKAISNIKNKDNEIEHD